MGNNLKRDQCKNDELMSINTRVRHKIFFKQGETVCSLWFFST